MDKQLLNNKVIVITGGAGLLGCSFSKGIAKNGGIAIMADIDYEKAQRITKEYNDPNSYGKVVAAWLDITCKESISTLIDDIFRKFGRIDGVVNNAYPRNENYGRKLEEVTYEDFCENVEIHLGGYFLVAQQFCIAFKKQGYGTVVNMSSVYGTMTPQFGIYEGTPMTMPVEYAAIKSAVIQLTRYFAQFYKGAGIRVNSISPGGIKNGQPNEFIIAYNKKCSMKGILDPEDLIGSLVYLLSDEAKYITGHNLCIDDGFSL